MSGYGVTAELARVRYQHSTFDRRLEYAVFKMCGDLFESTQHMLATLQKYGVVIAGGLVARAAELVCGQGDPSSAPYTGDVDFWADGNWRNKTPPYDNVVAMLQARFGEGYKERFSLVTEVQEFSAGWSSAQFIDNTGRIPPLSLNGECPHGVNSFDCSFARLTVPGYHLHNGLSGIMSIMNREAWFDVEDCTRLHIFFPDLARFLCAVPRDDHVVYAVRAPYGPVRLFRRMQKARQKGYTVHIFDDACKSCCAIAWEVKALVDAGFVLRRSRCAAFRVQYAQDAVTYTYGSGARSVRAADLVRGVPEMDRVAREVWRDVAPVGVADCEDESKSKGPDAATNRADSDSDMADTAAVESAGEDEVVQTMRDAAWSCSVLPYPPLPDLPAVLRPKCATALITTLLKEYAPVGTSRDSWIPYPEFLEGEDLAPGMLVPVGFGNARLELSVDPACWAEWRAFPGSFGPGAIALKVPHSTPVGTELTLRVKSLHSDSVLDAYTLRITRPAVRATYPSAHPRVRTLHEWVDAPTDVRWQCCMENRTGDASNVLGRLPAAVTTTCRVLYEVPAVLLHPYFAHYGDKVVLSAVFSPVGDAVTCEPDNRVVVHPDTLFAHTETPLNSRVRLVLVDAAGEPVAETAVDASAECAQQWLRDGLWFG